MDSIYISLCRNLPAARSMVLWPILHISFEQYALPDNAETGFFAVEYSCFLMASSGSVCLNLDTEATFIIFTAVLELLCSSGEVRGTSLGLQVLPVWIRRDVVR